MGTLMMKTGLLILTSLLLTACKAMCINACDTARVRCSKDLGPEKAEQCLPSYDKCVEACGK